MSRVGKQPITIPDGVEVSVKGNVITAKGAKGTLETPLFKGVTASVEENVLTFVCEDLGNKVVKSNFGLARALAANVITGVSTGFQKTLELRGVGYRAQTQGNVLNLSLGFSHPVNYELPAGVEASVDKSNIIISGIDKQQVGQVAAEIRAYRPPEPYKGKGVRYVGEHVAMKEGKRA
ncbi:MAG: 50S ribosomal protein L6 [Zetaproteobacteria bacterium CG2_30_46_52]|nr:MAG: 50S ribosomal protein L6 [Zetaproteobacteria bacterium CG2_30_46_52]